MINKQAKIFINYIIYNFIINTILNYRINNHHTKNTQPLEKKQKNTHPSPSQGEINNIKTVFFIAKKIFLFKLN